MKVLTTNECNAINGAELTPAGHCLVASVIGAAVGCYMSDYSAAKSLVMTLAIAGGAFAGAKAAEAVTKAVEAVH